MIIEVLSQNFCVCKVKDTSEIDISDEYVFFAKTDEEISLVCTENRIPPNITDCDMGWKAFRISGTLDFSLVGVLKDIACILADERIPIFAISTYNTDYILVKLEYLEKALNSLMTNGYIIKKL